MTHEQTEIDQLLGELRDGPVLLSDGHEVDAQRQRLLPFLRAHVRQAPVRRRRERIVRRALTGAGIGCAGLLGVFAMDGAPSEDTTAVVKEAGGVLLTDSVSLGASPDAPIRIAAQGELAVSERSAMTTAQGVQVELGRETRVGLDALAAGNAHAKLRLVEGSVRCSVPPLGQTGSFSVVTPNTEVVVHGTEFSVEVDDDESACVRVSEGKVEVRHDNEAVFLVAGQFWGCDEHTAEEPEVTPTEPAPKLVTRREPTYRKPVVNQEENDDKSKTGTLAEETRLMSAALSAERRGELAKARRLYARIVSDYPESPLAPEARRGLSRVD